VTVLEALGTALQAPDLLIAGTPVTRAEWLGAVLGLAMVVCNARLNPMGWVLALLSALLYAVVFLQARLYGQLGLQLLFAAMAVWGFVQWRSPQTRHQPPRRLDTRMRLAVVVATGALWLGLGLALDTATDNPAPYADALPTAGSLVATWLLARRCVENWAVWLAVNIASVWLFAGQQLWPTMALYAVMAGMSVWGWRAWGEVQSTDESLERRPSDGSQTVDEGLRP
jgi:nicotinamide mononucleotide transporter